MNSPIPPSAYTSTASARATCPAGHGSSTNWPCTGCWTGSWGRTAGTASIRPHTGPPTPSSLSGIDPWHVRPEADRQHDFVEGNLTNDASQDTYLRAGGWTSLRLWKHNLAGCRARAVVATVSRGSRV